MNRAHKNNFWLGSGTNHLDDGTVEKCKEICTKHSSLWSHLRRQHESRYHNYCDIKGCYYVSDEKWNVVKHKFNIHNVPMPEENKCPHCAKAFGQMSKLKKHLVMCQTDARPFACIECGKDFRQKESFTWHMKQEHPKDGEDNAKYFCICQICGTKYKTRSGLEQHKCHGPVNENN